ncbi:MAG TPA: protein kinase [Candidatus Binatia bacterium]|nr:protein kinase [Candidatus Binatia bacterium]
MAEEIKTPPVAPSSPDALVGTTVGRFTISKRLGAGGMGQVFGAEDTTLRRYVAIKRMSPGSRASEADRKRLLKEAQRSSGLSHPNIASIYDVIEHAGELWLVMEYIEGETLRSRLKRLETEPISPEEFFPIAAQCCEGLQAAHEKGIIHGDIKPENIMLAAGNRVKLLDFGVARRMWRTASPDEATQSMQTVTASGGTPAYMAPEVLLQKPDDGRSDLFSLGLVFYEMLGGNQPFRSDSLATTVARIVHENPPPLKNVPGPLAGVINRAMEKNPEARYPTAAALLSDLRNVQEGGKPTRAVGGPAGLHRYQVIATLAIVVLLVAGTALFRSLARPRGASTTGSAAQPGALPQTKILAVLPFSAPPNADAKLTALGEGVVESLAAKLGSLSNDRAFEVIPPRTLQEKKISTLADAARMFGANLGLVVGLEPNGDLVKVSYSLTSAQNNAALGSDSVSVPATDVFAVEGNVSEGTIKALELQLRPEEQAALVYHGTDRAEAYRDYLQARGYLLDNSKAENVDDAALMAREALKLDPNFGRAKAVLGESEWLKYSATKDKKWIAPAQKDCDDAVTLGNAGATGHLCLGVIAGGSGQYETAVTEFQTALGLEPANEQAAVSLALAYQHAGKLAEAEKAYQQAVQAHPNSRVALNDLGAFYRTRNEYEKALQMYGKVIEIAPEWYGTYVNVGAIYTETGEYEKAVDPLKKSISIRASYPGYVNLGVAYFGMQKYGEAAEAYEQALKLDPKQYVIWGNLGDAYDRAGKKQQSVASFRKAIELASDNLKVNPHDPDVLSTLANYYSMVGDRKNALLYLGQALQYGRNDKAVLQDAASVYNKLGESGLALEYLAKMAQAGYTPEKIRSMHDFDNLASTPAYQQLMKSSHQ